MIRFRKQSNNKKRGAALVELAITLPVLVLIFLGTIEVISMIFLRQTLKIAAYEATRVALVNGSNDKFATQAANQILKGRGVKDFNVSVTPSNFSAAAYGTPITVQVRVKANSNSALIAGFYNGTDLTASVTMMKEN